MALLTNPDGAAGILQSHSQPLALLHDDIVLIPQSVTRAQGMLPDIEREAATFRLKINVAKTECIMVRRQLVQPFTRRLCA